jgi:hypothetical protein
MLIITLVFKKHTIFSAENRKKVIITFTPENLSISKTQVFFMRSCVNWSWNQSQVDQGEGEVDEDGFAEVDLGSI